jgi:acetyltransferase-like isoleucine patch superfamily enzyme
LNEYHIFKPKIANTVRMSGQNIVIGPFSVIEDYVTLDGGFKENSRISIGFRCKIKQGAVLRTYGGEIKIGNRVSIGEYSVLAGHSRLFIGDCTIIAAHCYLSAANHIFEKEGIMRFQGEMARGITIGNDCWIGGNTMILDGVELGKGCIVGAGSVVTKSLPDYTVCHGNPVQIFKKREYLLTEEEMKR